MSSWLVGFDASEYQEFITWPEVAPGGYFGIIKISEGVSYVDRLAGSNVPGARRIKNSGPNGWLPFWYHFADGSNPILEAQHFLATLNSLGGLQEYEGLAYDFEINGVANPGAYTKQFEDYVTQQTGVRPLLYSNRSLMADIYQANTDAGKWLADPDDPPSSNAQYLGTVVPYEYVMQQYGTGHMPGVPTVCDIDYFFGNFDELKAYTKQPAVQTSSVTVTPTPVSKTPAIDPVTIPSITTGSASVPIGVGQVIDTVKPPFKKPTLEDPSEIKVIEADTKRFILTHYNKFLVALVGALATYLATHYGANHLVQEGLSLLTAIGVWGTPNTPQ
jgi:lysozyme